MNNLVKRTIFGAIYVALIICSILFFRPYFFQFLFLIISAFAVREFHKINHSDSMLTVCGVVLAWLLFSWISITCNTTYFSASYYLAATYGTVLILTIVAELFKKAEDPIHNWGILFAGQVMIALPFAMMNFLYQKSAALLLSLFIIIWLNDTGAYCVGSLIGKHKMFERVSPKKSWEGFVGGAVVAIIIGYLLFSDPLHLTGLNYNWLQSIIMSLTIVIFGTLGDLQESLMKRTLGIKDSGNVIPGHGGLLDRFDSVLLATPALVVLLLLF